MRQASVRQRILKNDYKDAQETQGQLQGTEWELQQHENGNIICKQEPGRNEKYNT